MDKAKNERNLTESNSEEDDERDESQGGIKVEGNEIRNGNLAEESASDTESEAGFPKVKRRKLDHCSEEAAGGERVKSCKKGIGDNQRVKKASSSTEKTGKPETKNRIKETLSETNMDPSIERTCKKLKRKRCNEKNFPPNGEDSTGNIEDIEKTESRDTSPVHTNTEKEGIRYGCD